MLYLELFSLFAVICLVLTIAICIADYQANIKWGFKYSTSDWLAICNWPTLMFVVGTTLRVFGVLAWRLLGSFYVAVCWYTVLIASMLVVETVDALYVPTATDLATALVWLNWEGYITKALVISLMVHTVVIAIKRLGLDGNCTVIPRRESGL